MVDLTRDVVPNEQVGLLQNILTLGGAGVKARRRDQQREIAFQTQQMAADQAMQRQREQAQWLASQPQPMEALSTKELQGNRKRAFELAEQQLYSGYQQQQYQQTVTGVRGLVRGIEDANALMRMVDEYGSALQYPGEATGEAQVLVGSLLNSARQMFEAGALQEAELAFFQDLVGDPTSWNFDKMKESDKGRLRGFTRLLQRRLQDSQIANPMLYADQPHLWSVQPDPTQAPPPRGFREVR